MTKQQTAYTPHDADNLIDGWNAVSEYAENCVLIAFDGCHKIYLAMDETEAQWFKENYNGAECDDRTFEGTPEQMFELLKNWYENSCSLKFIQSVTTNEADPNEGFESLIPQGAHDEVDDEDDYE